LAGGERAAKPTPVNLRIKETNQMKKRLIVSAVTGTVMFGSVFAFAASLGGVTTDKLGADDAEVQSCDTNNVAVDYDTAYSATTKRYEVTDVVVSSIEAACNGQTITVGLAKTDGTKVGDGTVANLTSASVTVPINEKPAAEDVNQVHVVIASASSAPAAS
jgi:hypothetical protein